MTTKLAGAAALVLLACGGAESTPPGAAETGASSAELALPSQAHVPDFVPARPVCPGPSLLGDARCHAHVVTDQRGAPFATSQYTSGYGPGQLRSAYALSPATGQPGSGPTIAIVDAYDDPNAEADLGTYRKQFGLGSCTTANGCFRKVNQSGVRGSYPRADRGWALEISLDLQMASAICPACKILLVEASSSSFANLAAAVDMAATLGASVISNSYGGTEYSGEVFDESHFNHPGIAITVSSGDSGYGVEFPAASQYVTAVGGTSLSPASNARGWSETAWSGAGSGCSAFVLKPSWQADPGCARRTVADVSAVADPATGVAVFDSYAYYGQRGWFVIGGTSVSAPVVAGVFALAGNAATVDTRSYPYAQTSSLFDVTSGSNGTCSSAASYLCTAVGGYDGPTGLGSPNGAGAF